MHDLHKRTIGIITIISVVGEGVVADLEIMRTVVVVEEVAATNIMKEPVGQLKIGTRARYNATIVKTTDTLRKSVETQKEKETRKLT